jgi:glyoxylase-like metal-dependent hydrolase (beta-lactamase superfamily II)
MEEGDSMSTQPMLSADWLEVGRRTWVRQNGDYGMNTGLIVGDERALVIDTGAGPEEAADIYEAVRSVTELPLVAVNTHAHFDHFFGNAAFAARGVEEIWAHRLCAEHIVNNGDSQRHWVEDVEPGMAAAEGEHTAIVAPNRIVDGKPVDLDLGSLTVTLFHLGRGHTDNDLLVGAGPVLFTGDLVEQGADPAFEDAYPADWIRTLGKVAALDDLYEVFVPGHGQPVGADFVTTQMNKMRSAVHVAHLALGDAATDATKGIPILPYGPEQSRELIRRLRAGF